jgi:hypothetical protein
LLSSLRRDFRSTSEGMIVSVDGHAPGRQCIAHSLFF